MNQHDLLCLLIGKWTGTGRGEFPTIEPFEYLETLTFVGDHRPFVHYEETTQRRSAGQTDYVPSHWESGFLRLLPDGEVELINTQGSGRLERLAGSLEQTETGLILHLKSTAFLNDPRMVETSRTITIEGDDMHYSQTMHTTASREPAHHVEARLKRAA
jgi:THAP4-like, heme-binding beta-barrel domain